MARLNTRWNQPERQRSSGDTGSILAVNLWKLAADSLLQIENEGFETTSYQQRLEVMLELLAYAHHLLDRILYARLEAEQRAPLVQAAATKLVEMTCNNYRELKLEGQSKEALIKLLNRRGDEYAECRFHDDGPGFTLRRLFGEHLQKTLGERDNKWAPDYALDVIAPQIYKELHRSLVFLLRGITKAPEQADTTRREYTQDD